MSRAAQLWLCLFCMVFGACSNSHVSGPVDAGLEDHGSWIVDQGPVRFPPLCDEAHPCPTDSGVSLSCGAGVCWERAVAGGSGNIMQPICIYRPAGTVETTWTGEPCAITSRTPSGGATGVSVPVELCLELLDPTSSASVTYAGVFDDGCIWSDGLPVTAAAPQTPCEGFAPVGSFSTRYRSFCGGSCGSVGCPEFPIAAGTDNLGCAGRSDTRSFGVCTWDKRRCSASTPPTDIAWMDCSDNVFGYAEPCGCMVTYPQDPASPELQGWRVAASVCERYQAIFPDSVECRDSAFNLIPE